MPVSIWCVRWALKKSNSVLKFLVFVSNATSNVSQEKTFFMKKKKFTGEVWWSVWNAQIQQFLKSS